MTITNNTFKGIAAATPYNNGNGQSTLQLNFSNVQGVVSGNDFDGVDIGIIVANNTGTWQFRIIYFKIFTEMHRIFHWAFSAQAFLYSAQPSAARLLFQEIHFKPRIVESGHQMQEVVKLGQILQ